VVGDAQQVAHLGAAPCTGIRRRRPGHLGQGFAQRRLGGLAGRCLALAQLGQGLGTGRFLARRQALEARVHRGELGADCEACHVEDARRWLLRPEIAQHDATRFPLVGTHAAVACWRCHSGAEVGDFSGASVECVDCHLDDLARATEPDHQASGFVDDCQRCHLPTRWDGAGFTHSTWPLTGAHRVLDCEACHTGGMYQGTPRDCVACHLDDYQGTTDPDHELFGFSTACEQCHDTSSWEGARFGHEGIVDNCTECHLDDYQATTDPDHQAAGFPTACEDCHRSTTTWFGADFDHDFPIDSGDHRTLDCSACHTNPASFAQFTCIDCHAHRQEDMEDEHDDVPEYTYQTAACYMCHPDGRE